ncbi:MAG: hypothetical protein OCD02_11375 [Spirochaetaceae bacterium]
MSNSRNKKKTSYTDVDINKKDIDSILNRALKGFDRSASYVKTELNNGSQANYKLKIHNREALISISFKSNDKVTLYFATGPDHKLSRSICLKMMDISKKVKEVPLYNNESFVLTKKKLIDLIPTGIKLLNQRCIKYYDTLLTHNKRNYMINLAISICSDFLIHYIQYKGLDVRSPTDLFECFYIDSDGIDNYKLKVIDKLYYCVPYETIGLISELYTYLFKINVGNIRSGRYFDDCCSETVTSDFLFKMIENIAKIEKSCNWNLSIDKPNN